MTDEEVYSNRVKSAIFNLENAIKTKDRIKIGARIFDLNDVLFVLKSIPKSDESIKLCELAEVRIKEARQATR